MFILYVSQAQAKFTKILDKKTNKEKAVVLPYSEYIALSKDI